MPLRDSLEEVGHILGAFPRSFAEDGDPALFRGYRCRCGGTARCREATDHTLNGLPTGRTYGFRCDGCGRRFTLQDPLRALYQLVVGGWFGFLGSFVVPATGDWVAAVVAGRAGVPSPEGFSFWLLFASFLCFGAAHLATAAVRTWRGSTAVPVPAGP